MSSFSRSNQAAFVRLEWRKFLVKRGPEIATDIGRHDSIDMPGAMHQALRSAWGSRSASVGMGRLWAWSFFDPVSNHLDGWFNDVRSELGLQENGARDIDPINLLIYITLKKASYDWLLRGDRVYADRQPTIWNCLRLTARSLFTRRRQVFREWKLPHALNFPGGRFILRLREGLVRKPIVSYPLFEGLRRRLHEPRCFEYALEGELKARVENGIPDLVSRINPASLGKIGSFEWRSACSFLTGLIRDKAKPDACTYADDMIRRLVPQLAPSTPHTIVSPAPPEVTSPSKLHQTRNGTPLRLLINGR